MKKPDFIIAGVARSGTTHLYSIMDANDCIYMAKPMRPEPKFFSRESIYANGFDWYLEKYFTECPDDKIAGEKSTEYFESEKFPSRIKKHLPEAKIILMLRDPIDRAISNYWWSVKNKVETRTIVDALSSEMKSNISIKGSIYHTAPNSYLSRSLYYERLVNLYSNIDSNNIHLIVFENYIQNLLVEVNRLSTLLNCNLVIPAQLIKNEADRSEKLPEELFTRLKDFFYKDLEKIDREFNLNLAYASN